MSRIMVIGPKLNGKGAFSAALRDVLYDCDHVSTSNYLVHRVAQIHGLEPEDILAHKEDYRQELIDLGNRMCDIDPGSLVSICLFKSTTEHIIVDGVRRENEFNRVKDWFDMIIYVERKSQPFGPDNFELWPDQADVVIENNGSLAELDDKAVTIAMSLKGLG